MTVDVLFLRKLLVAFVIGFVGSIGEKVVSVGPVAELNAWKAVWVSAVSGAVIAGVRAVLVLLPKVNLVPSDAQPVITKAPVVKKAAAPKPK